MRRTILLLLVALPAWTGPMPSGPEDESVFAKGLRPGQHESLLYVWTSDADAKDPDFLTVIDADPKSPGYAKIITTVPTGATVDNEAHHFGYTVNADRIFAGGLVSNRMFIYDVQADPRHPKRSEEHTSELQSPCNLVCRLLLEKKKNTHSAC